MTMSPPVSPSLPRRSLRARPSAFASTSTAVVNHEALVNGSANGSSGRRQPRISSASAPTNISARRPSKRSSKEDKGREGKEELGSSGTEEDEADEDTQSGEDDKEGQPEEGQISPGVGRSHRSSRSTSKRLTKYEDQGDSSMLNGRLKKKRRVTERRILQNKTAQKKYRDKKKFLTLRTLDFAVTVTRLCSRELEGKERKAFKQILKDYLADVSELDQSYLADFLTKTGLHSKLLEE
ncbi:hypothetical protein I314_04560 [Cryptococcus bacillisporus CA1873]|uniref:BZIP domain-containing protein n=1 Tax=Cryptococcus bacillisporus CA1873 TaxID=1296111 RepID=A0ABR5B7K9_CRYGA|nr:hypothetical protein I314_04560 [Cryptococcus bacillisporus CA1873]|eukprot:KIR59571.1 hypothetical protein I314_04560 [Cryptococcus gattii CA1873]